MKQPTNKISIFNIYLSTKLEFYINYTKILSTTVSFILKYPCQYLPKL